MTVETKVIDNWLDEDLVSYLDGYFLYKFPHYFGHMSAGVELGYYSSNLNPLDPLNAYLFYKLQKSLKLKLKIRRMYINIQHGNMNGAFHTDDGTMTCLYMVTKNIKNKGYFEIKDERKIDFIQNRLIAFDSTKQHKGHAPNENNVRITLAFKTDFLK